MTSPSGVNATEGGLVRARILEIEDVKIGKGGTFALKDVVQAKGGVEVGCMFNPFEYTVTKSNSFAEAESANGGNSPRAQFQKAGPQTLQLHLLFDTYASHNGQGKEFTSVTEHTNKLWQLMAVKTKQGSDAQDKDSPPLVAFIWGKLYFVAYITQMTQKFTLFAHDGTPVRAEVDITFTQYVDLDDYPNQNPTSGGGPIDRVWCVTGGDRIDTIAARVYGSAANWRLIAHYNQLDDPTRLRPGQQLLIPFASQVAESMR
ncbi:MAG: LysM peptidoglycan-binding domain-containing protein [Caldilineaceae bacterium]